MFRNVSLKVVNFCTEVYYVLGSPLHLRRWTVPELAYIPVCSHRGKLLTRSI